MQPFEANGFWTSSIAEKITDLPGSLSYTPQAIRLKLMHKNTSDFFDFDSSLYKKPIDVITGLTNQGPITLLRSHFKKTSSSFGGGVTEITFEPQIILKGIAIQELEVLQFDKIWVQFEHMNSFVAKGSIRRQFGFADAKTINHVLIEYEPPDELDIFNGDSMSINLSSSWYAKPGRSRAIIETSFAYEISLENKTAAASILFDIIKPIQRFQSFCLNRYVEIASIGISSTDIVLKMPNGELIPRQIHLYTRLHRLPEDDETDLLQDNVLVNLSDVQYQFGKLYRNWIELEQNHKIVFDQCFSILMRPKMYLENQFLTVAIALEGYHRFAMNDVGDPKFSQVKMPLKEFRKFKNSVLQNCPEHYVEQLKQKFQYNEPSLKDRLTDIINDRQALALEMMPNRKKFIRDFVNTRNTFAHAKSKKDIDTSMLFRLTTGGLILLQSCLLSELAGDSPSVLRNKEIHSLSELVKEKYQ